eukprot:m.75779 g.75779  ORF g.75779 m.75779 type:complete len:384 (-) comp14609_c0_seq1:129-1280(-)
MSSKQPVRGNMRDATEARLRSIRNIGLFGVGALLVLAVALAVAFNLGWIGGPHIERLDLADEARMKLVFFGGHPWVIACVDSTGERTPAALTDAAPHFKKNNISMATLDCTQRFAGSGKTPYERFSISRTARPAILLAANGLKPKQIPTDIVASTNLFVEYVKKHSTPEVTVITSQEQLSQRCLSRSVCFVAMIGPKSTAAQRGQIAPLANEHRTAAFAAVSATDFRFISNPTLVGANDGLSMLVLQRDEAKKGSAASYKAAVATDSNSLRAFVLDALAGRLTLQPLLSSPFLRAREKVASDPEKRRRMDAEGEKIINTDGSSNDDDSDDEDDDDASTGSSSHRRSRKDDGRDSANVHAADHTSGGSASSHVDDEEEVELPEL